ncbi:monocarboxylate transporter 5-like [Glandiceps talaboti]
MSKRSSELCELLGLQLFYKSSFFTLMCIALLLAGFGYLTAIIHLVAKAVSTGIPKLKASFLLTCLGVGGISGRILNGLYVDLIHLSPVLVLSIHMILFGINLMLIALAQTYPVFITLSFFAGYSVGVYWPLVAVCCKTCLDARHLSLALGWFFFFNGVGAALGPPTGGKL